MGKYSFEAIVFKVGNAFFDHCHEAAVAHARMHTNTQVFYVPQNAHTYLVPRRAPDTAVVHGPREYGIRTTTRGVVYARLKKPVYPTISAGDARKGMDLTPERTIQTGRKRLPFK